MKKEEKQIRVCLQILQTSRNELNDLYPYLDGAFAYLDYAFCREREFRVDGTHLLVHPEALMSLYCKHPEAIRHGYLHMLLHCLFLHLFTPGTGDSRLWNLACDMAVEQIIAREKSPRLYQDNPVRSACLAQLGDAMLSAEKMAALLQEGRFPYSIEQLETAFRFDNHSRCQELSSQNCCEQWERLLVDAAGKKAGKGKRGTTAGSGEEAISELDPTGFDYRTFLRRFTVPREEVELDPESFDYAFYHFGMEHYGSMPLLEPLEYREVRRLEELVIAIDTSGSCSAETVGRFLAETYEILESQENFFRRMKVYFIQCDCLIQDVTLIHSREEWLAYAKKIRIQGRGGTDFSPVFDYVRDLRIQGELKSLKALLYFTDGDGAYPSQPPDYETAFVLLKETGHQELIPKWGKLLLI